MTEIPSPNLIRKNHKKFKQFSPEKVLVTSPTKSPVSLITKDNTPNFGFETNFEDKETRDGNWYGSSNRDLFFNTLPEKMNDFTDSEPETSDWVQHWIDK